MTTREDVHSLVDGVPDDQLDAVSEIMRAAIEAGLPSEAMHRLAESMRTQGDVLRLHIDPVVFAQVVRLADKPVRTFASAGALSAEHDLAERAEDRLRTEDDKAKRSWSTLGPSSR